MKKVTVFLGMTNSGKDYQAKFRQLPVLKFAKPAKELLSKLFDVDYSLFEDKNRRMKTFLIDKTVGVHLAPLELLLRFFDLTQTDKKFGVMLRSVVEQELNDLLFEHDHLACTDLRQLEELEWLLSVCDKRNIELDFVVCRSNKEVQLTSDVHFIDILNKVTDLGYEPITIRAKY